MTQRGALAPSIDAVRRSVRIPRQRGVATRYLSKASLSIRSPRGYVRAGHHLWLRRVWTRVAMNGSRTMANCSAGECSCECSGGKGCGCIASSDSPEICECHCYGSRFGGGLTLALNARVDVSISGLPLHEAAKFLNSVHSEQVLVPADMLNKLNKRVHLKAKRKRLADVLKSLGLTTSGQKKKAKRK